MKKPDIAGGKERPVNRRDSSLAGNFLPDRNNPFRQHRRCPRI